MPRKASGSFLEVFLMAHIIHLTIGSQLGANLPQIKNQKKEKKSRAIIYLRTFVRSVHIGWDKNQNVRGDMGFKNIYGFIRVMIIPVAPGSKTFCEA